MAITDKTKADIIVVNACNSYEHIFSYDVIFYSNHPAFKNFINLCLKLYKSNYVKGSPPSGTSIYYFQKFCLKFLKQAYKRYKN